jgi:hypothetical protein
VLVQSQQQQDSKNKVLVGQASAELGRVLTRSPAVLKELGQPRQQHGRTNTFQISTRLNGKKQRAQQAERFGFPKVVKAKDMVPDAHDPKKRHAPIMYTTDLALRFDPEYGKITKRFLDNPKEFEVAFAKAWFKLTHRDMGPKTRYTSEAKFQAKI